MKTTYFLLLLTVAFNCATVLSQNLCPYCQGTGNIVKNIKVPPSEPKDENKVRCSICGEYTYPSAKHCHIQCNHCHGKGKVASNKEVRNDTSYFNPETYGLTPHLSYGLPFSDAENAYFRTLCRENKKNARHYAEWRNTLNFATQYFTRALHLYLIKGVSVQEIDKMKSAWDEQLAEKSKTYYIFDEMKPIVDELVQQYTSAYNDYRYSVTIQNSADEINNFLFQM